MNLRTRCVCCDGGGRGATGRDCQWCCAFGYTTDPTSRQIDASVKTGRDHGLPPRPPN